MPENEKPSDNARLPQVDRILKAEPLKELHAQLREGLLTKLVREELACRRSAKGVMGGSAGCVEARNDELPLIGNIADCVRQRAERLLRGGLQRVVNGTGVILNTNLGRAPLPIGVLDRMKEISSGYSTLEYEVQSGKRGDRNSFVERLLQLLVGAESAIVVNNNAAAVMLAVNSLAKDREVLVSRGELIEIGGSFRLPDVIEAASGKLKEVGTTNRTRASDFAAAASENTGMVLRCHRSNFEIRGFTEEPSSEELLKICKDAGIPLVEDLGAGALFDYARLGLIGEPTVESILQRGADLVLISGDKLLGGVQAGIALGRRSFVGSMRKNPMYRALRADKLTISLLEGILLQYTGANPERTLPVLYLAARTTEEIQNKAIDLIRRLMSAPSSQIFEEEQDILLADCKMPDKNFDAALKLVVTWVKCRSTLGGGSLPGQAQESVALSFGLRESESGKLANGGTYLARAFRQAHVPVVGLVRDERFLIDCRTILEEDEKNLLDVIESIRAVI